MRFTLVDRIVELDKGQSISTVKNLSLAEEYLQDHFPGFAVLPGVMMVEALVQSGAWLMRATEDFRCSTILLKQAKAVKFKTEAGCVRADNTAALCPWYAKELQLQDRFLHLKSV